MKTRQIDASVYCGDYHSQSPQDWSPGRQCVECGAIIRVLVFRKAKRTALYGFANLPPRNKWEEPIA